MVCNFLLTRDKILPLDGNVSRFDYFMNSEDLNDLMKDKNLLREFIESSGQKSIIVRPIGSLIDGVYSINGKEVVKVGDKKW